MFKIGGAEILCDTDLEKRIEKEYAMLKWNFKLSPGVYKKLREAKPTHIKLIKSGKALPLIAAHALLLSRVNNEPIPMKYVVAYADVSDNWINQHIKTIKAELGIC